MFTTNPSSPKKISGTFWKVEKQKRSEITNGNKWYSYREKHLIVFGFLS